MIATPAYFITAGPFSSAPGEELRIPSREGLRRMACAVVAWRRRAHSNYGACWLHDSPYVFPSTRGKGDKPIDRHALSQAVRRLRLKLKMAEWSPHDARRSATTWARTMGIPRDTTEALTHHAIVGSGKTYDRYDMQAEKRQAVDAIADYISRTRRSDAATKEAA